MASEKNVLALTFIFVTLLVIWGVFTISKSYRLSRAATSVAVATVTSVNERTGTSSFKWFTVFLNILGQPTPVAHSFYTLGITFMGSNGQPVSTSLTVTDDQLGVLKKLDLTAGDTIDIRYSPTNPSEPILVTPAVVTGFGAFLLYVLLAVTVVATFWIIMKIISNYLALPK